MYMITICVCKRFELNIGLLEFLVEKMGFDKTRVENGIAKLVAAQKKKAQGRMDSFFASAGECIDLNLGFALLTSYKYTLHVIYMHVVGTVTSSTGLKRKAEPVVKKGKAPAAKKGGFGKR